MAILQTLFSHKHFLTSAMPLQRWTITLLALALSLTQWAQEPASTPQEPTVLKLSNGMQIYLVEDPAATEVSWELMLDYTSFLEGKQTGIMDLVGAMLGQGSDAYTAAGFAEDLASMNASFEGSATGFVAQCPQGQSGELLRLVADAVVRPTFPQDALDMVKASVVARAENAASSAQVVGDNMVAVANFGELHPYGEVTTPATLDAIGQEDLMDQHTTFFRPNIGHLLVVGNITPDEAYAKANVHFGKWNRGNIPYTRIIPVKYAPGNQVHFAELSGAETALIQITQAVPFPPSYPDAAAVEVMATILGGGQDGGRIGNALTQAPDIQAQGMCELVPDPTTAQFMAQANVPNGATAKAIELMLGEIKAMRKTEVDSLELAVAKELLVARFKGLVAQASTLASHALDVVLHDLPQGHHNTYIDRVNSVTSEDVLRMAKSMIKSNNLNICVTASADVLEGIRPFDASGGIEQHNPFGEVYVLRSEAPAGTTVESVVDRHFDAIGGARAWRKVTGMATTGSVEYGSGLSLERRDLLNFSKKSPAMRMEMTMAGEPVMVRSAIPGSGQELQMGKVSELGADKASMLLDYANPSRLARLTDEGHTGTVLGQEEVLGATAIVLQFTNDGSEETYWFDAESGKLIQQERPGLDGNMVKEQLKQYLPYGENGLELPAIRTSNLAGQTMTVRLYSVDWNPEFEPNAFDLKL